MPRLAGRVAFITGAGNGIGRATAILFAREGARVAIAEIDAQAGEETAHLAGNEAIEIRADVTDPDSLQSAIRATVDNFGRLDVLHNNAGGSTAQDDTAANVPLDEFWRAIKLDLYGTFLGCRFGIPELIKAGGGSVINMSSNVALMGVAGRDCYTAAKGGIAAITRSLAVAYAPQRVRVNAIAPSATMTERVKKLVAGNAALTRLADSHLLGLIEPNDVACTALYLASDESSLASDKWLQTAAHAREQKSSPPLGSTISRRMEALMHGMPASSHPSFRDERCTTGTSGTRIFARRLCYCARHSRAIRFCRPAKPARDRDDVIPGRSSRR